MQEHGMQEQGMQKQATVSNKNTQGRLIAVDFARVLAIWFMVQGHTLDVLLLPSARQGGFFNFWLFLRGLTAPMFLVLSGTSFAIATIRRWDSHTHLSLPFFKRFARFAFFIALGYAMHLPMKSFKDIHLVAGSAWQDWLQIDVLQCIGATLIFLQLLVLAAKTQARFAKFATMISAFIILLTPLMWGSWTHHLPLAVSSYFNGNTGSLFPLFPWAGYVFFGVGLGYAYSQWQLNSQPRIRAIALAGCVGILLSTALNRIPFSVYRNLDYWHTSPNLFLMRIGCVCVILAFLTYVTQRIALPQKATQSIAQESLTIYIAHIAILYGSTWNLGLRQVIGPTLNVVPTLEWITLLLISMTLMAWMWNWFKHAQPAKSFWLQSAAVALIAYSLT